MKRIIRCTFVLLAILCWQPLCAQSSDISKELIQAFKTGNAKSLSEHLNDNVELVILQTSDFFTQQQAKNILIVFFRKHEVKDFSIEHSDVKKNAAFVIGTLSTEAEKFRVSILIRKNVIYQLRIEELKF